MNRNPFAKTATIEFEGIGGSGKSTLITRMEEYLSASAVRHRRYKQPWFPEDMSSDELFLKKVIYETELVESALMLSREDIQRGITAQRNSMFRDLLVPDFISGEIDVALLDRCWLSACAYAEATTDLSRQEVAAWHEKLPHFFVADLILILDAPAEVLAPRTEARAEGRDIFEHEIDLQERVRQAYLDLARDFSHLNIVVLDATMSEDDLFLATKQNIDAVINERCVKRMDSQ